MALDPENLPSHPTPLLTQEAIASRVAELAAQIRADYASTRDLHMVCVLKGAFVFFSDLVRQLDRHVTLDFIVASSYGKATRSSGEVRLIKDLDTGIEGRDVMIVEDIVDTGLTLTYLTEVFKARGPRSVKTACLLSKPSRRQVDVPVDYVGFTIEDRFVIGYGLDYAERYRNLPYIGVLDE
ncbi:hypoxanthine phosphoribosyltransferase [Luteitalea sp.]